MCIGFEIAFQDQVAHCSVPLANTAHGRVCRRTGMQHMDQRAKEERDRGPTMSSQDTSPMTCATTPTTREALPPKDL